MEHQEFQERTFKWNGIENSSSKGNYDSQVFKRDLSSIDPF